MKRPPVKALSPGSGSGIQLTFCRSAYALALLATIVFGGIEIYAAYGNCSGVRMNFLLRRDTMLEDRIRFSGIQDKHTVPNGSAHVEAVSSAF